VGGNTYISPLPSTLRRRAVLAEAIALAASSRLRQSKASPRPRSLHRWRQISRTNRLLRRLLQRRRQSLTRSLDATSHGRRSCSWLQQRHRYVPPDSPGDGRVGRPGAPLPLGYRQRSNEKSVDEGSRGACSNCCCNAHSNTRWSGFTVGRVSEGAAASNPALPASARSEQTCHHYTLATAHST
jgi:hypothetical protein